MFYGGECSFCDYSSLVLVCVSSAMCHVQSGRHILSVYCRKLRLATSPNIDIKSAPGVDEKTFHE